MSTLYALRSLFLTGTTALLVLVSSSRVATVEGRSNPQPWVTLPHRQQHCRFLTTAMPSVSLSHVSLATTSTTMMMTMRGGAVPAGGVRPSSSNNNNNQNEAASATTPELSLDTSQDGLAAGTSATTAATVPSSHDDSTSTAAAAANTMPIPPPEDDTSTTVPWFLRILYKKSSKKKNYKQYAKKLKNRNATNVRRKVMHASFGLTFAALNHALPKGLFVGGMAILSSATLLMELLRYKPGFQWMNDALHGVLGSSLRKHEMEGKFTGSFYFFTGVTLTAAFAVSPTAATLGVAQLALADPSASYFGRATRHVYWSRIEGGLGGIGRNKGILGFLGGALFCVPFNYRVLSLATLSQQPLPGGTRAIVSASLALGLAGALADLAVPTPAVVLPKKIWGIRVPPLHLDDNFVVPIVSAWACKHVFASLGWEAESVQLARYVLWQGSRKPGVVPSLKEGLPPVDLPPTVLSP